MTPKLLIKAYTASQTTVYGRNVQNARKNGKLMLKTSKSHRVSHSLNVQLAVEQTTQQKRAAKVQVRIYDPIGIDHKQSQPPDEEMTQPPITTTNCQNSQLPHQGMLSLRNLIRNNLIFLRLQMREPMSMRQNVISDKL